MYMRFALLLSVFSISYANAQTGDGNLSNGEAWCDLNSSNCVCSEPLTATDYIDNSGEASSASTSRDSGPRSWNPNDTTENECSWDSDGSHIRTYNWNVTPSDRITPNNPTGSSINAAAYSGNALPNRVAEFTPRFRGQPYNGAYRGINWSGHDYRFSSEFASFTGRRSYRWYTWYPPDFLFTSGGDQNSKKWQSLIGSYWTSGPSSMSHHNTPHDWSCDSGGVREAGLLKMNSRENGVEYDAQYFQGVWIRTEIVVDQVTDGSSDPGEGNGTRIRWYHKNVTAGTPEVLWIDSFSRTTEDPWTNTNPNGISINNTDWSCGGFTDLYRRGEEFAEWTQNNYGQTNDESPSSDVPKWKGWAYVQVAAWTQEEMDATGFDVYGADVWDNTKFRIGSAYEMEGEAGSIDPHVVRPDDTSPLIVIED